jgi:hypothetical protein
MIKTKTMSKELLKKYMKHVIECETHDYIPDMITDLNKTTGQHTVVFTKSEIDELTEISQDIGLLL